MFKHTRGSATKRFAKFGRQKQTFCGEKEEKAVSQIKSDRLSFIGEVVLCLALGKCAHVT